MNVDPAAGNQIAVMGDVSPRMRTMTVAFEVALLQPALLEAATTTRSVLPESFAVGP